MSTVKFQINPSHVYHFISNKDKGVCIEVTNLETQETGWLYVGHNTYWSKHKKLVSDKVTWVLSCYLKDNEFSPFEGGNAYSQVRTSYSKEGIITAEKVGSPTPELEPLEDYSFLESYGFYQVRGICYRALFLPEWGRVRYFRKTDIIYEITEEEFNSY